MSTYLLRSVLHSRVITRMWSLRAGLHVGGSQVNVVLKISSIHLAVSEVTGLRRLDHHGSGSECHGETVWQLVTHHHPERRMIQINTEIW